MSRLLRHCDRAIHSLDYVVTKQRLQHKNAMEFAELIRDGWTMSAIARGRGLSDKAVHYIMKSACPPFRLPDPPVAPEIAAKPLQVAHTRAPLPVAPVPPRPEWSYPGDALRRLAREARAEIEASGWFGRRGHVE